MTRADLQKLTRIRLTEARILLRNGCYEGAYYLAGYAVECAIKACIAKNVRRFEFPDKTLALESYTHNLTKLAAVAEIDVHVSLAIQSDPVFRRNWNIVQAWSEQSRYRWNVTPEESAKLYDAIVARNHGVLACVKRHW